MSRHMIRVPKIGDLVRLHVSGCDDVDNADQPGGTIDFVEVPAGAVWTIDHLDYWPMTSQGLTFTLVHESGVVNVIDEGDLVDGCYPFAFADSAP